MYKRKTATYKKLTRNGRTVRNGPFSSGLISSSQIEMQMVIDRWER